MQLPDPILNLQIPEGISIHGGSRVFAADAIRSTARKTAEAVRDSALMAAQEVYRTALVAPQLARETAVETANIAFAIATDQAQTAHAAAIAAINQTFEIDPLVTTARNSREATTEAANLILIAAIREQVIADAKIAYEMATASPRTIQQTSVKLAVNAFNAAISEARTVLENEVAGADTIYNEADNAERVNYDAAEMAANHVYNIAIEAAKTEYDQTVSVPRPLAATVGLMVAVDPGKPLTTVLKGDDQTPVKIDVALNTDAGKPFNATIRGDENSPVKIDFNLKHLPKGKLKISGIDIGFYLFSWRIFSIKVKGVAELDDGE